MINDGPKQNIISREMLKKSNMNIFGHTCFDIFFQEIHSLRSVEYQWEMNGMNIIIIIL